MQSLRVITEVPSEEQVEFDRLVKEYRAQYIRNTKELVAKTIEANPILLDMIVKKNISPMIKNLRELVWQEYLSDEVEFNAHVMKDLHARLDTPREILNKLIENNIVFSDRDKLEQSVKATCGEYAGRIFPYIYRLALSNTQSRRSRSGATFEYIVYHLYEILGYTYDSQKKVGRKIFNQEGLGKKVDSILPSIEKYQQRRNKTIIGTMKTSLRERWQEVAEEIERTKIPEIHLLTVDEDISESKAKEMSKHNIVIVAYDWVSNKPQLKSMKNIISFEEYLFDELPAIYDFWGSDD